MSKDVIITLTEDEAWVLFDLTRRSKNSDQLAIEDKAEKQALRNLGDVLEKNLPQVSEAGYQEFISKCKFRLRDEIY